jgi:hypothetical protein
LLPEELLVVLLIDIFFEVFETLLLDVGAQLFGLVASRRTLGILLGNLFYIPFF